MRSSNALMTAHAQLLVQPQVSMGTGASGHCSDAMTLPIINDWLFHLEGGTIPPYCALHFLPFISIGVNCLCISIVFGCSHCLSLPILSPHYCFSCSTCVSLVTLLICLPIIFSWAAFSPEKMVQNVY